MTDELEQMSPNQRRALDKALSALETFAATWAAEIRLSELSARIAAVPTATERAKRIAAMIEQGFIEGAYRHYLDHKDKCAELEASRATPADHSVPVAIRDMNCPKCHGIGHVPADGYGRDDCPVCFPELQPPQSGTQNVRDAWKPIETAPRDGRNILIRFGRDGVSQAMYVPGVPHPWKFIDTNDGVTWLINSARDGEYGPSHWMPMPAPPQKPVSDEVKP